MKKLIYLQLALVLATVLAGCKKDTTTILFEDMAMGFVRDDYKFLADDGLIFDFGMSKGSQECYEPGSRLLVDCFAEEKTGDNEYRATIVYLYKPLYKEALKKSEVKDWEAIGDDDSSLRNGWYSGDCLNMLAAIRYSSTAGITHMVNLIVDDTRSSKDTLYLDFRHNACGDTGESETSAFYTSFPLKDYLKGSESTISIRNMNETEETHYIKLK